MSKALEPSPVLRVCGCLTGRRELLPLLEARLVELFGEVALRSAAFPFDSSSYYAEEMGPGLCRYWYGFSRLFGPELLPESRQLTGAVEESFAEDGKRRVNLDPGYLDHGKLVLASLKQAPDKLYLGQGVWAHTCLRYRFGGFEAPDHSFPDFKDGRYDGFFREARRHYSRRLRAVTACHAAPPGIE